MLENVGLTPDLPCIAKNLKLARYAWSSRAIVEGLREAVDQGIINGNDRSNDPYQLYGLQADYWAQRYEMTGNRADLHKSLEALKKQVDIAMPYSYPQVLANFRKATVVLELGSAVDNFGQFFNAYERVVDYDLILGKWSHLSTVSINCLQEAFKRGKTKESRFVFENIEIAAKRMRMNPLILIGREVAKTVGLRITRRVIDWYQSSSKDGDKISSNAAYTGKI